MSFLKAFRTKQPAMPPEPHPGRWPIAVWLGGEFLTGTQLWSQRSPEQAFQQQATLANQKAAAESSALLYLTDEGLDRPVVILGRQDSGITMTLARLLARAGEDTQRVIVYIDGAASRNTQANVVALLQAFG